MHLVGPGSFSGERKLLPHGSKTELYWSYRAWARARQQDPASYAVFMRVCAKVIGPNLQNGLLKFRKISEHGKCDVCARLKKAARTARGKSGFKSSHAMAAQESLSRHVSLGCDLRSVFLFDYLLFFLFGISYLRRAGF